MILPCRIEGHCDADTVETFTAETSGKCGMKHLDFKDGNVIEILEEIIDLIKVSYWRLAGVYLYVLADELRKQDPRKRRQRMDDPKSSDRTRAGDGSGLRGGVCGESKRGRMGGNNGIMGILYWPWRVQRMHR